MNVLEVKNVGPIKHAKVEFGDLTILVGPQASGKSVFLQMLKLAVDKPSIVSALKNAGINFDFGLLDIYLGPGMVNSLQGSPSVSVDGTQFDLSSVDVDSVPGGSDLFYIPAHRSLCFTREGWIRGFSDFTASDPYSVREFSEEIRMLLDLGFRRQAVVFPEASPNFQVQDRLSEAIFAGFNLEIDRTSPQKRLVLKRPSRSDTLLYLSWSAGQREFVPLLLGLTACLPGHNSALPFPLLVVEEPELGLHPDGIMAAMAAILEMLALGIKVCISTHSNSVLEIPWAIRLFQDDEISPEYLLEILRLPKSPELAAIANSVMTKTVRVHFFDRKTGTSKPISNLDPGASDEDESGWGGLTGWSGHIGNVIAKAVSLSGSCK